MITIFFTILLSLVLIIFGIVFTVDNLTYKNTKNIKKNSVEINPYHACDYEKVIIACDTCNCKHELYYCKICGHVAHKIKELE